MTWTSQQHAGQLSLFPTGSLVTRRQHHVNHVNHVNRGDYYRTYLGTVQWQRRREQALERDRFRCQNCGSEARLVVHHQSYEHLGDEWPEDLKVLCWDCHQWEHERRRAA